jgi:hypothetical protein
MRYAIFNSIGLVEGPFSSSFAAKERLGQLFDSASEDEEYDEDTTVEVICNHNNPDWDCALCTDEVMIFVPAEDLTEFELDDTL